MAWSMGDRLIGLTYIVDIGGGRLWCRHVDHIRARHDEQKLSRKPTNSEDGYVGSTTKDAVANDTAGEATRAPQAPEQMAETPIGGTCMEGGEGCVDPHNQQNIHPVEGTVKNAEPSPQHPTAQFSEETTVKNLCMSRSSSCKRNAPDHYGWQLHFKKEYEQWTPLLYLAADWGCKPSGGDRRMFSMCIILMQ